MKITNLNAPQQGSLQQLLQTDQNIHFTLYWPVDFIHSEHLRYPLTIHWFNI